MISKTYIQSHLIMLGTHMYGKRCMKNSSKKKLHFCSTNTTSLLICGKWVSNEELQFLCAILLLKQEKNFFLAIITSSWAISSCSSSSLLRSVRALFCLSSDWPIRAANSRSRSFCGGRQACAGLLLCHHGSTTVVSFTPTIVTVKQTMLSLTSSSRCVTASMSWYVFVIWPTLSEHSTAEEKRYWESMNVRKRHRVGWWAHDNWPETM